MSSLPWLGTALAAGVGALAVADAFVVEPLVRFAPSDDAEAARGSGLMGAPHCGFATLAAGVAAGNTGVATGTAPLAAEATDDPARAAVGADDGEATAAAGGRTTKG